MLRNRKEVLFPSYQGFMHEKSWPKPLWRSMVIPLSHSTLSHTHSHTHNICLFFPLSWCLEEECVLKGTKLGKEKLFFLETKDEIASNNKPKKENMEFHGNVWMMFLAEKTNKCEMKAKQKYRSFVYDSLFLPPAYLPTRPCICYNVTIIET